MRVRQVDVGGASLAVREWGEAGGRPVLFAHALGPASSAALLDVSVAPLVEAGFHVVSPDLPGYGDSPALAAEDYSVPAMADRLWSLADQLGLDRVVLGGHSWGGAIAAYMAAARPERVESLVLVDSGHVDYDASTGAPVGATLEEMVAAAGESRLRARDRADLAGQLEVDVDDPLVDLILIAVTQDPEGGLVTKVGAVAAGAARYHLMQSSPVSRWPAIAAGGYPVLLLLATEPAATRELSEQAAPRFAAAVPHADVRLVEGVTHSLTTDLRDQFGRTVVEWLASSR